MSPATDLVRYVLGPYCDSDQAAQQWLERALAAECEPFHYFAVQFNLSEVHIYERAAQWAGLNFVPALPAQVAAGEIHRVDALADVRSLRVNIDGQEALFAAPGLAQLLGVKERIRQQPDLSTRIRIIPPAMLRTGLSDRCAVRLLDESRNRLARLWPFASAHLDLTMRARLIFVGVFLAMVLIAALTPIVAQPVLVPALGFFLLVPAGLRLAAAIAALKDDETPLYPPVPIDDLPVYTILIALRDEANMVPQLIAAMRRIDYPPEKLDIKFVVESESRATLEGVARELNDARFELVIVPDAPPQTKPKALNYALPLVRGEYLVIYNAEDIPQPDQLRRAVSIFRARPEYDCIQAELVIDNAGENGLTALFTGEYAGLFGLLLPSLARWRMPLPLGGSSNHFRVQSLKEVGGWDAFNVTEDVDLGLRLTRLRYRTGTFDSRTYEEAPVRLGPWIRQRTRWMKGWMQTFIVHNSRPRKLLEDMGWRNFLIFQAYVGGMIFSAPLISVFTLLLAARVLMGKGLGIDLFSPWGLAEVFVLVTGYSAAFAVATMGLLRLGMRSLLTWQILLPFYWLLTSWAAFRAIYELVTRPYFWAKTPHGQTRFARGTEH